ncbi:MAG: VCBS repeat-containing protein [Myxococcales bacterium]|nr:VCBS repeat-containing protein [Myxococcales bacterium]
MAATTMAACGPTITLDDDTGETITDTDGETDSETTPTTQPPPLECVNSSDCDPGYECIDNECVPYDYCSDGGCCDYGYDGCCYDGCCYGECYYYECYGDADCGVGGLCEGFQECVWLESITDCGPVPDLLPIPLVEGEDDPVLSLSFVDADGDATEDVVVTYESGAATLHRFGPEDVELIPLPFSGGAPLLDVTAADFNGDGLPDLASSDSIGQISILAGDGLGGFAPLTMAPAVGPVTKLEALDWNGDGAADLAMLGGDALGAVYLGNGAGDFMAALALSTDNTAYDLETGTFGADAFDDVAVHTESRGAVFLGNAVDDTQADGDLQLSDHGRRRLAAGDFDGGGLTDIAGYSGVESWDGAWMLIEGWRDGFGEVERQALFTPIETSSSGDVDGDGLADVVALGSELLTILHGSPAGGSAPLFSCLDQLVLEPPARLLSVGDFDGNGLDDIVVAGPLGVFVLTH